MRNSPSASRIIAIRGAVLAPFGGLAGGRIETAGGVGLEYFGLDRRYNRERCDLSGGQRSKRLVEDLTACNGDRTRGHDTCADGCCNPTGD